MLKLCLVFLVITLVKGAFISYPQVNSSFSLQSDKLLYHVGETVNFRVYFPVLPKPDPLLGKVFFQVHARSRPEFNRNITEVTGLIQPIPAFQGKFVVPSMFSGITYFLICSLCYKKDCENLYGRGFESLGPIGIFNTTTGLPPLNEIANPNSGIPIITSTGYDNNFFYYKGVSFVLSLLCLLLVNT